MPSRPDWKLLAGAGAIAAAIVGASYAPRGTPPALCHPAPGDSASALTRAADTVARLRGKPQRATTLRAVRGGFRVRTEDAERGAYKDGGVVLFDCRARVTLVWLDGG